MIVSVVSLYDTRYVFVRSVFVRMTTPPLFSSVGTTVVFSYL